MIKTYRFKLKPTKAQEQTFEQWLGTCRYVYNLCLEYKIMLYKDYGINLSRYDVQRELPLIRKDYEWVNNVNAQALQDVVKRLFIAYDGFFKQGKGFPKFAKKGNYNSFTFPQDVILNQDQSLVQLPKIGKVKYRKSQPVLGNIKTTTITKEANGWYINLCCEVDILPLPKSENTIGLDVGIKSFIVTSDGEEVPNPKHLYKYQYKLRKAQRAVSRKKKGSNNRKKAVHKLAILHLKVRNTRKDFHHKLTTKLIRENQTIVVEDIKVSNMLKNHRIAKSISDVGWGQFSQMLEYKSKWYGRGFIKVAPQYTSQDCSVCGCRNSELTLKVREWTCESCGANHDRDKNAATNIKNKGLGHSLSAYEIYSDNSRVA